MIFIISESGFSLFEDIFSHKEPKVKKLPNSSKARMIESGDSDFSGGYYTGRSCSQVLPPRSRSIVSSMTSDFMPQSYNLNSTDLLLTPPILAV
jgi:hypothetical protein